MVSNILAVDFILKDQHKNDFVSKAYRGKKILLSFHPLAWTNVCAEQMKSIEKNFSRFEANSVIPLGISVDTIPSKQAWAQSLGIVNLRLLSDFWPHGHVAKLFEIFREKDGFSERANILIGIDSTILWKKVYIISELPDIEEVFHEIQNRNES